MDLLQSHRVRHVDHKEALELDFRHSGRLDGLLFPYVNPLTGHINTYRLRRDNPQIDEWGKIKAKYLCPHGDNRHLYHSPLEPSLLPDTGAAAIIVEAEKSGLALAALAQRMGRRWLLLGTGGAWGWRGKTGIAPGPNSERLTVHGPLPDFGNITWRSRESIICFDSNAATNEDVQRARRDLTFYLKSLGAFIRVANIPKGADQNINGPDDYLAAHDDEATLALLDSAGEPSDTGAFVVSFAEMTEEALRWSWPGRFPAGKLCLLVGDPGQGKSLFTLDMAARITQGLPFPDGEPCNRGSVLILSAEDDARDTIKPRLRVAGADMERVYHLESMRERVKDGKLRERYFNLATDLWAIQEQVQNMPDLRAIIIDPVSAYLPKIDANNNSEVRSILAPLAKLAADTAVLTLCITHLRKSAGSVLQRAIQSIAFSAAARAVWAVGEDPTEFGRKLLLPVKKNLGRPVGGLAFRIVEVEKDIGKLEWERGTVVSTSVEEVFGAEPGPRDKPARNAAKEWLMELLNDGPMLVNEVDAQAKSAGFSWRTVKRAKEDLGVKSCRRGTAREDPWEWKL